MSALSLAKNPYRQRNTSVRDMRRKGPRRKDRSTGGRASARGQSGRKAGAQSSRPGAFWRLAGRLMAGTMVFLLLASIGVGLVWAYRTATTHPYFGLASVGIQGNRRLQTEDVLALTGLTLGHNILALNLDDVRGRLTANPWVADAEVRRVLPNAIRIRITEREAAFWTVREQALWYADAHGEPIAPLGTSVFAVLPLLTAPPEPVGSRVQARERAKLAELVEAMGKSELFFGAGEVVSVALEETGGAVIMLRRQHPGQELALDVGLETWRRDLAGVDAVLADLARRGELAGARTVTARQDTVVVDFNRPAGG